MMKTPEQYFEDQDFQTGKGGKEANFTPAELAFMQKYLGMDEAAVLKKLGLDAAPQNAGAAAAVAGDIAGLAPEAPASAQAGAVRKKPAAPVIEREPELEEQLRQEPDVQLVSFYLAKQEFTVPISAVQEVIKYMHPTRLPAAPPFVAGVINLRGRVTPLIRLGDLLGTRSESNSDPFIVVCRRHGLQIGLMIDAVHTMYRTPQEDIDWSIESHLGVNVDYISGLMKSGDKLIGIISVDRIVDSVLQL